MQMKLGLELDFGDPLQRFAQDFSFELQLMLVWNVLIVASAALLEVWTARFDAIGRGFDQLRHRSAREPRLLLPDLDVNPLPRQHKRHEHRHVAAIRAWRRASQAVTAINQFFDGENQVLSVAWALLPEGAAIFQQSPPFGGAMTGKRWALAGQECPSYKDQHWLRQPGSRRRLSLRGLMHIKQTQPRYAALLQQALAYVLLLELLNLSGRHVAAVGSEIAVRFGANDD
jgi:hypothetical protein